MICMELSKNLLGLYLYINLLIHNKISGIGVVWVWHTYWAGRGCSDSIKIINDDDASMEHDFNAILTRYKKMHLGSFSGNRGPVLSV